MEEENSTPTEPESGKTGEGRVADAPVPESQVAVADIPATLDLNELQAMGPSEIEKLCCDFELRVHPGRTRHQQILDLLRSALGLGITVTAEGFFDQIADSFGVLRWPSLNFLPVPEDVGVPRAVSQKSVLPGSRSRAAKSSIRKVAVSQRPVPCSRRAGVRPPP